MKLWVPLGAGTVFGAKGTSRAVVRLSLALKATRLWSGIRTDRLMLLAIIHRSSTNRGGMGNVREKPGASN